MMRADAPRHWIVAVIFTAPLAAGWMTGCGDDLETHPAFREQKKVLARLSEDTKVTGRQIEELNLTLNALQRQIRQTQTEPKFDTAKLTAIEARLAALEERVHSSNETLAELENSMEKRASTVSRATAAETSAAPPSEAVRANVKATVPRPEPQRTIPRGFYYELRAGETIEAVAQRNGIAPERLREANAVPPGRSIRPGQQIYIPNSP